MKNDIMGIQQKKNEVDQNMGRLHTSRRTSEVRCSPVFALSDGS